jgi:hypothetical protein
MATNLLKDLEVKNANAQDKAIRKLADGDGLFLWVYADGTKYWRMRTTSAAKRKACR